jgi:hypothetical protein
MHKLKKGCYVNARGRALRFATKLRPFPVSISWLNEAGWHRFDRAAEQSTEPSANRQWNRDAASRIEEMSGQSHPPKPPVLGRIKFGRSFPRASCARFLSNRRGGTSCS